MPKDAIKIYGMSEKLNEAYDIMCEKLNAISQQFQLSYFEFFGLIECFKCDLIKQKTRRGGIMIKEFVMRKKCTECGLWVIVKREQWMARKKDFKCWPCERRGRIWRIHE